MKRSRTSRAAGLKGVAALSALYKDGEENVSSDEAVEVRQEDGFRGEEYEDYDSEGVDDRKVSSKKKSKKTAHRRNRQTRECSRSYSPTPETDKESSAASTPTRPPRQTEAYSPLFDISLSRAFQRHPAQRSSPGPSLPLPPSSQRPSSQYRPPLQQWGPPPSIQHRGARLPPSSQLPRSSQLPPATQLPSSSRLPSRPRDGHRHSPAIPRFLSPDPPSQLPTSSQLPPSSQWRPSSNSRHRQCDCSIQPWRDACRPGRLDTAYPRPQQASHHRSGCSEIKPETLIKGKQSVKNTEEPELIELKGDVRCGWCRVHGWRCYVKRVSSSTSQACQSCEGYDICSFLLADEPLHQDTPGSPWNFPPEPGIQNIDVSISARTTLEPTTSLAMSLLRRASSTPPIPISPPPTVQSTTTITTPSLRSIHLLKKLFFVAQHARDVGADTPAGYWAQFVDILEEFMDDNKIKPTRSKTTNTARSDILFKIEAIAQFTRDMKQPTAPAFWKQIVSCLSEFMEVHKVTTGA